MDNIESLFTVILCLLDIRPILKKALRGHWLFFVLGSFLYAGKLHKQSPWGGRRDAESKYAKTIILLPALYLRLIDRFEKEKALIIMTDLVQRISHAVDYATARKNLLFTIKDPFQRWLKYRSILITEGFGLHNEIEDVYISKSRMHYTVKRCIFHDVFSACGVPELTPLVCDYDQSYHSAMFSEFYFDRNGSWQNTIGHGAPLCHYVWKDRAALTQEFREYLAELENDKEHAPGGERRRNTRRQFDRRQYERRQYSRRNGERRRAGEAVVSYTKQHEAGKSHE